MHESTETTTDIDTAPFFEAYAVGLIYASACTNLTNEEATVRLNHEHPTGIASGWAVSDDAAFASGQPNPCPCEQSPGRRHVLFSC